MSSKNAIVVVVILTLLTGVATDCVTKKDGFSYECSIEISGEKLGFAIVINPNRVPPSVKISLSAFGKSFGHFFEASGEIFIPGLVIDGVGFFLNVKLNPSSDKSKLHLKIELVANLKITRFRITIFDNDVKKTAFYEDVKSWWDAQSGGVKFAIIAVPIIIIALCCCCCCCCCRK